MKIPNYAYTEHPSFLSLARIVSEDSQLIPGDGFPSFKSSKDS